MNKLFYGDNLKILRDYIKDESVNLVYLDPPFNSNRNCNVLFRGRIGQRQRIADHGVRRHMALEPRAEARITHHRDTESTEKDQSKNLSDLSASVVNTSYRVNGNNQMMPISS